MNTASIRVQKPCLVGITGSLGTGKSLVGKILIQLGFYVIDTDDIAHEILRSKNKVTVAIVREFGEVVIDTDLQEGFINKKELAKIVFYDKAKRKKLESLVHPHVIKQLDRLIALNKDKEIIFVQVPLLFEAGLGSKFDEVWCVVCKKKIQIERLKKKGFKLKEIKARTKAQLSQRAKSGRADFVIDNSTTVQETKKQLKERLSYWLN